MPAGFLVYTQNSGNHNKINVLQENNTGETISRMRKAGLINLLPMSSIIRRLVWLGLKRGNSALFVIASKAKQSRNYIL